ncbi:2-dehydro-3-deoxygalactonokinase [Sphingomonas jejuensis]|uniref:2-dehydro-3-deoxygalactonokinase n=1 Tax=Sphingomonas jejuensis TaxID=904715 RepID=UPI00315884C0
MRRRGSSSRAKGADPLTGPARLIAVDWGSTRRRAYALDAAGVVVDQMADDRGALSIAPAAYPDAVAALRTRLGRHPIVAAGMVGSDRGLQQVPYISAPADIERIAGAVLHLPEHDMTIVPGVCVDLPDRQDVMRGEEVQVLGALAAGQAPPDALFCQPGTHNKWIRMAGGKITDVATAMTGELFALLRAGSVLSGMLDGPVADGPAFRSGVERGLRDRDLLGQLFGVRAAVLIGRLPREDAAARASGLLIGADVAARDVDRGGTVHLIADQTLGDLYAAAIEMAGGTSQRIDSQAAFLAGIHRLWELLR